MQLTRTPFGGDLEGEALGEGEDRAGGSGEVGLPGHSGQSEPGGRS